MEDDVSAPDMPADYGRRMDELRRLREEVTDVTATARSRNGDVWVEVGASGELRAIRFGPQALKRLSGKQLAHSIMTLVAEATEDATGRARELTAAFLPKAMAERLRDGEKDLMALLPSPPRVPEFGQE
jgi:DNA-binding protein YbaB